MNDPITRFVVLSHQRAGSHYVMNLLNSHQSIHCRSDFQTSDIRERGADWAFQLGFAAAEPATIVGFLVKFKQGIHGQLPSDVKVLLLQRSNLLAQYLSKLRSREFGCYDSKSVTLGEAVQLREQAPPVRIQPAECLEYFDRVHDVAQSARRIVSESHSVMDLAYEDVCADSTGVMQGVHAFLGAEPADKVHPTEGRGHRKLDSRPLEEAISNYDELCAAFRGSRWAHLFERG